MKPRFKMTKQSKREWFKRYKLPYIDYQIIEYQSPSSYHIPFLTREKLASSNAVSDEPK